MSDDDFADLNTDAIYAAFVFLKSQSESELGRARYRGLIKRVAHMISSFASIGATNTPLPKVDWSPEALEQIYPGERTSVEFGLALGRRLVYGPKLELDDEWPGPVGVAVRKFRQL